MGIDAKGNPSPGRSNKLEMEVRRRAAKAKGVSVRRVFLSWYGGPRPQIRCLVRQVSYHQFGHFMMGEVKVKVNNVTYPIALSGTWGHDGLPIRMKEYQPGDEAYPAGFKDKYPGLWNRLHVLPKDLTEAFWSMHDEDSVAALNIRSWARGHIDTLRKLRKP